MALTLQYVDKMGNQSFSFGTAIIHFLSYYDTSVYGNRFILVLLVAGFTNTLMFTMFLCLVGEKQSRQGVQIRYHQLQ